MVSVFFADTARAKGRQTSTMTPIILVSPCGDHKTMQTTYPALIPLTSAVRCTSSARMTVSSPNLWRTAVSTAAKILKISGDITHLCRSPCFTSNQSEQTPSSGCPQALIPSRNYWMTSITCGGTPMRVSTCHRRGRSTVPYAAFWRFINHMKRDIAAFRLTFCSLRTSCPWSSDLIKIRPAPP